jgi:hypothetical protein
MTAAMKIVFVSANPADAPQLLLLNREFRAIGEAIRSAKHRELFDLKQPILAARPDDIIRALVEEKPHVVHFSGHGTRDGGLYFEDENGNSSPVRNESLVRLFRALKEHNVRIVVLNACNTHTLAQAVVEVVDCAVGMNAPIKDHLAVKFASAFYHALASGSSVCAAFGVAKVAIEFPSNGGPGARELTVVASESDGLSTAVDVPRLYARTGVDPAQVILAAPKPKTTKESVARIPPKSLRILHMSDLNISSSVLERERASLVNYIDQVFHNEAAIDYVIVCGNITADCKPESFNTANALLRDLCKRLLPVRNEENEARANRVVCLPGRNDVQLNDDGRFDPVPFSNFYRQFYRSVFEVDREPPSLERTLLLELKDLTIVGVVYWNRVIEEQCKQELKRLEEELQRLPSRLANKAYDYGTPTLLVSPESPVLCRTLRPMLHRNYMTTILETDLRLDLHLFGAGPVVCLPVEPFVFRHIGLSTGPRPSTDSPWPLRLNLIEFIPLTSGRLSQAKIRPISTGDEIAYLKVTAYQRQFDINFWESHLVTDGHLDRLIHEDKRTAAAGEPYTDASFLEDLLEQSQRGPVLHQCLPGTGIEDFFKEMASSEQKLPPTLSAVIVEEIKSIPQAVSDARHGSSEAGSPRLVNHRAAWANLIRLIKQRVSSSDDATGQILGVLHDLALPSLPEEDRQEWLDWLKGELAVLTELRAIFLYLVAPATYARTMISYFPGELTRVALDDTSFGNLVSWHNRSVPIEREILEQLTGKWRGIGRDFLNRLQRAFDDWPGSTVLSAQNLDALVRQALSSPEIMSLSRRLRESLRKLPKGEEVFGIIRRRIRVNKVEKSPFYLDRQQLMSEVRATPAEMANILELLSSQRLITEEQFGGANRYRLLVLAPFMTSLCDLRVFFSVQERDRTRIEALLTPLSQLAQQAGAYLETFLFSQDAPGQRINWDDVNRQLERCNNLVACLGADTYARSANIGPDVQRWVDLWERFRLSGRAALIPLAMERSLDIRAPLNVIPRGEYESQLTEHVAKWIYELLCDEVSPGTQP